MLITDLFDKIGSFGTEKNALILFVLRSAMYEFAETSDIQKVSDLFNDDLAHSGYGDSFTWQLISHLDTDEPVFNYELGTLSDYNWNFLSSILNIDSDELAKEFKDFAISYLVSHNIGIYKEV